jgi:hypothetical protein
MADDVLDDITRLAQRCERTAALADGLSAERLRLMKEIQEVDRAWSHSWIGYHTCVYTADLTPCRPGEHFDSQFTPARYSNTTTGEWAEFDFDAVVDEIKRRAQVPTLEAFDNFAEEGGEVLSWFSGKWNSGCWVLAS